MFPDARTLTGGEDTEYWQVSTESRGALSIFFGEFQSEQHALKVLFFASMLIGMNIHDFRYELIIELIIIVIIIMHKYINVFPKNYPHLHIIIKFTS